MAKNSQNLQNRVTVAIILCNIVVTAGSMAVLKMLQPTGEINLILRTLVFGVIFGGVGAAISYFTLKGR